MLAGFCPSLKHAQDNRRKGQRRYTFSRKTVLVRDANVLVAPQVGARGCITQASKRAFVSKPEAEAHKPSKLVAAPMAKERQDKGPQMRQVAHSPPR